MGLYKCSFRNTGHSLQSVNILGVAAQKNPLFMQEANKAMRIGWLIFSRQKLLQHHHHKRDPYLDEMIERLGTLFEIV